MTSNTDPMKERHVLPITRSYRSPSALLNDNTVSDHLSPLPHEPVLHRNQNHEKQSGSQQLKKRKVNDIAVSDCEAPARYSAKIDVVTYSRSPLSKKRRITHHLSSFKNDCALVEAFV